MENLFQIETLLTIIIVLLAFIAFTLTGIQKALLDMREDLGLFRIKYFPKDE